MRTPSTRRGLLSLVAAPFSGVGDPRADAPAAPVAPPVGRAVTRDDLRALTAEAGLGHRLEAVSRMARTSIRLEVVADGHAVGPPLGRGLLPDDDADIRGALRLPGRSLPGAAAGPEVLDVSFAVPDPGAPPVGPSVSVREGTWRHDREGAACWGPSAPLGFGLRPSREMVLPRAWAACMDPLMLDPVEADAWQRLRRTLAETQGVVVGDETIRGTVLHRLGGYPDERLGDMPLTCELLDLGIDLGGEPARLHQLAAETEAGGRCGRWRLLVQLSADDRLGWHWGGPERRMYVWIDRSDLRAGHLTRVHVLVR